MRNRMRSLGPRLWLVALGIGLGYLARITFGGPPTELDPPNSFREPIVEPEVNEAVDLPIITIEAGQDGSGLVPPISIPQPTPNSWGQTFTRVGLTDFNHGDSATFEPHGEQVCASGCALSRHPSGKLTQARFDRLLDQYSQAPLDETNSALEELLFYGPQTRRMIDIQGYASLDGDWANFLSDQLEYTHAKISIRVVDQYGVIRTWLDQSRIPFDRRHVFEMETKNLQPLVTSGTVKRVGLKHLWARL